MKRLIQLIVLAGFLFGIHACYYDNPPAPVPFECSEVSYVTHLVPIWEASCISGCHDGNYPPNMVGQEGYAELVGGYVNLAIPEESSLYKTVTFEENAMPPGGPQLSETEIQLVLCWISEGAPNN